MGKVFEDLADKRRIDSLYEAVKGVMENLKLSLEQAMAAMNISEMDREELKKMFQQLNY